MGFGTATITQTTSSTGGQATSVLVPRPCVMILIRTPATNVDNIYVSLGYKSAVTGDILIRPNESVSIDFSDMLMLKVALGQKLEDTDFITQLGMVSATASQSVYFDTFAI